MFFCKELEQERLSDCFYLEKGDRCLYLGDYTPHGGFNYSEINQLILNLKKPISKQGNPEYRYKTNAIKTCAKYISNILDQHSNIVIIPIPPSKSKDNELYDDRIIQIAEQARNGRGNVNILEFVVQITSTEAMHLSNSRLTPKQLQENYRIVSSLPHPNDIDMVFILDDVLTTGSHFKAIKNMLLKEYPILNNKIYGLFIAKVVRQPS